MGKGVLRKCCLCVSPQTASFVLGSLGILFSCILLAPLVVFLENQTFYIAQFGRSQTERGNYVDDDQVPEIVLYSKVMYSVLLAMDVVYIFSCILLLAAVATKKHLLMVPWLVYVFTIILVIVTIVLSFIIGLEDYMSLAVFLGSSPIILSFVYMWVVVLSAYQIIRADVLSARGPTTSASQSSLASIKEGIQRVLGGTPPPPYEAVTTDTKSPKKNVTNMRRQISTESATSDTMFFDMSSTRRSSDRTPSTKPASPILFKAIQDSNTKPWTQLDIHSSPRSELFSRPARRISSSASHSQLQCTGRESPIRMRKSASSFQNFVRQSSTQINQSGGTMNGNLTNERVPSMDNGKVVENEDDGMKEKKGKEEDDLFTTWSSLSDDTSSISTTSLDSGTKNNILV